MSCENKQTLIFRLYQVLFEYSDTNHPMTQKDIIECLDRDYNLIVERKAIGRNISYLKEMGFDIQSCKGGVYLGERPLEYSELRLLIDSVLCSTHINKTHSKQLIDKLITMGGKNFKPHVRHVYNIEDWNKTKNFDVFYNIEIIDESIEKANKIEFDYNKIGVDRKLHTTAHHIASPYQMILHNQHYYLMACDDQWENIAFYHMDKITNIKIVDEPATPIRKIPGYEKGINYKELSTSRPYMFTDKPDRITIKADGWMMDELVDWFGYNFDVKKEDDKIVATINVSPMAMEFWLMQYGTNVEVLHPEYMRNKIKERLQKMTDTYK